VSGSCPAEVIGYTLVDAQLDTDIMPLRSYSMNEVAELLNIRVDITACSPSVVESVYIDLDRTTLCENFAPYTVFGDKKGDYHGKAIGRGRHIIQATPYTQDGCKGTAGKSNTRVFTVRKKRKKRRCCQ
jgi:hypothetical protein